MRSFLKRLLPPRVRRALRRAWNEAPHRFRDGLPDLRETLAPRSASAPLPPARLRRRVSGTTSRRQFLDVGRMAFGDIRTAFETLARGPEGHARWLDFGCGSGRIARHLLSYPPVRELWGVDVDREAVAWCAGHLPRGTYLTIPSEPPMPIPDERFDVVVSGSVFTHLPEDAQWLWLSELHRVLRPGGLLITCTHSPKLTFMRPDLTAQQRQELDARGFLFARGGGPFNDDGAFHARPYLETHWTRWFQLELFEELGYCGFQDLSAWRKGEGLR